MAEKVDQINMDPLDTTETDKWVGQPLGGIGNTLLDTWLFRLGGRLCYGCWLLWRLPMM